MSLRERVSSFVGNFFQPRIEKFTPPAHDASRFPESLVNASHAQVGYRYQSSSNPPFKGAQITRKNGDWQPGFSSGDRDLGASMPLIITRPRDAVQNDPAASNIRRKFTNYVIGSGIVTFADAQFAGTLDNDYNDESDEWYERWYNDATQFDCEGRLSGPEMQAALFNELQTVGNAFAIQCYDDAPDRIVPLCYQMMELEQLDIHKNRDAATNVNKIVRGIEFDARNRVVAFWFFDANPYGERTIALESKPIPVERVIHIYVPFRPSATQGVSWYNIVIQEGRDFDTLIESELVASILASYLTIVHKTDISGGNGIGFNGDGSLQSSDDYGNPLTRLGPGIIARIPTKDDITPVQGLRPNTGIAPFGKVLQGRQSMGVGLSQLRMTGDYSQSSYTSARGAHLDDQATFIPIQKFFGARFVLPVRKRFNDVAVAEGLFSTVTPSQYLAAKHRWSRFDMIGPGREQLDPEKETDAGCALIDGFQSTLKEQCGLRGRNWRRVIRQQGVEQQLIYETFKDLPNGRVLMRQTGGAPKESQNRSDSNQTQD